MIDYSGGLASLTRGPYEGKRLNLDIPLSWRDSDELVRYDDFKPSQKDRNVEVQKNGQDIADSLNQ